MDVVVTISKRIDASLLFKLVKMCTKRARSAEDDDDCVIRDKFRRADVA